MVPKINKKERKKKTKEKMKEICCISIFLRQKTQPETLSIPLCVHWIQLPFMVLCIGPRSDSPVLLSLDISIIKDGNFIKIFSAAKLEVPQDVLRNLYIQVHGQQVNSP